MTSRELRQSRITIVGGSAGDWSAVYLHVNLGSPAGVAAVALGAFSVTMAAGRLAGDRLAARFGPVRLVRASGLVAGLGLAAGLLVGTPAAAIADFALLGLGLAGIFPQIVSSAARLDPGHAGRNIGRIAAVAYSGLLSGPVAIGAIASGVGLRDALLVPAALALGVTAAAGVLRPQAGELAEAGEHTLVLEFPYHVVDDRLLAVGAVQVAVLEVVPLPYERQHLRCPEVLVAHLEIGAGVGVAQVLAAVAGKRECSSRCNRPCRRSPHRREPRTSASPQDRLVTIGPEATWSGLELALKKFAGDYGQNRVFSGSTPRIAS